MEYTEKEKKDIEMCNIFVNQNAMISYVGCDEKGNLIFPQCDAKPIQTLLNLIEKQQKEIEELKSKTQIISPLYIKENYISKEAIRKKIKEIDENGYWDFLEERDCEKTINILKELLGDE